MKRTINFMKSMLTLICIGLVFNACQSDESIEVPSSAQFEMAENPYVINEANAISSGKSFLKDLSDGGAMSLRSTEIENLNAEIKEYDFTIAVSDKSVTKARAVAQKVPVYAINYKDDAGKNAGVVMMVGDERIPDKDKVIMYSTEGELKADWTTSSNAEFFKDRIAGYIHNQINNPEEKDKDDVQLRYIHNASHTYYLVPMQCDWKQDRDPYNRYSKGVIINGAERRFHGGCVAVAMAQIMTHHNWPKSGTFPRYTNIYTPQTVTVSYALTNDEYERLIYARDLSGIPPTYQPSYENMKEYAANRIAECGYRVNMMYGMKYKATDKNPDLSSYAYDSSIPAAFAQMGYSSSGVVNYDINKIKTDLQNQRPVYMSAGRTSNGDNRHGFIIKGVAVTPAGDHYVFLALDDILYNDGSVFNSKVFSDPTYQPNPAKGEIAYTYRYVCSIIHNIRPNK